jgi:Flp pilus assembly protein TadD
MNLGKLLMQQNRLDSAKPELLQALRLNPKDPAIHNNLGVAEAMSGRVSEAIKHFTDAINLDPKNLSARQNLARALAQKPPPDGTSEPPHPLKTQDNPTPSLPSPPP